MITGGRGHPPSGHRLHPGPVAVPIPQVLPVGVLHAVPAGDAVLRPPLDVADVGGGQDPGAHDGPGRGHAGRAGEEAEEEAAGGLPGGQLEDARLVRRKVTPHHISLVSLYLYVTTTVGNVFNTNLVIVERVLCRFFHTRR